MWEATSSCRPTAPAELCIWKAVVCQVLQQLCRTCWVVGLASELSVLKLYHCNGFCPAGIAMNAVLLTFSTAASLMIALKARIIQVTDRFADTVSRVLLLLA